MAFCIILHGFDSRTVEIYRLGYVSSFLRYSRNQTVGKRSFYNSFICLEASWRATMVSPLVLLILRRCNGVLNSSGHRASLDSSLLLYSPLYPFINLCIALETYSIQYIQLSKIVHDTLKRLSGLSYITYPLISES